MVAKERVISGEHETNASNCIKHLRQAPFCTSNASVRRSTTQTVPADVSAAAAAAAAAASAAADASPSPSPTERVITTSVDGSSLSSVGSPVVALGREVDVFGGGSCQAAADAVAAAPAHYCPPSLRIDFLSSGWSVATRAPIMRPRCPPIWTVC